MMPETQISSSTVKQLCSEADRLTVPQFQRGYVWTESDRLALVKSILEGIPIGSLVMWSNRKYAAIQSIIDGQQRLTSLIRILDPNETDPRFKIHVDVDTGTLTSGWTLGPRYRSVTLAQLVSEPNQVIRDSFQNCVGVGTDVKVNRLGRIADAINYCSVAITSVTGPMEYAREVYHRINSTGVPVDLADMRTGTEIPLRDLIERHRDGNQ
jgi:hypothetical protein